MKEEGFNPNAVITDQVIDALANIQDHEPGSNISLMALLFIS